MKLCLQVVHNTHQPIIEEPPVVEAEIQLVGIYKDDLLFEGVNPDILTKKTSLRRKPSQRETSNTITTTPNTNTNVE